MKQAVILIPGIMGSVLMDGETVVWPGGPAELLRAYQNMHLLMKPALVPSDVIRSVSISSQYDHLIQALSHCGFQEGDEGTLVVFPYDWRMDNAETAAKLASCVDDLANRHDSAVSITLLAHSMGGLVSRCYLESGLYNSRAGFANVEALITMGTPHRGAPMALAAVMGYEKRLFLNKEQVQAVANDENFPSLYQLLPPENEPFALDRAIDARFAPLNIYDPEIASQLGLSVVNLAAAKSFHAMLDLTRRPPGVRYFFFAGTRKTTTHAIHVSKENGKRSIKRIERDDAGDGTVPFWSSAQSGVQCEPVGGAHGDIYKNATLRSVLGFLLGKAGLLAAEGHVPELSLRESVSHPGKPVQVAIDLPRATIEINGELRFRRRVNAAGHVVEAPPWNVPVPIRYTGPEIDHLAVVIPAPSYVGVYEIAYFSGGQQLGEMVELFVQDADK
jgi:pimeloyl-ACP methyl ester carboxylesterase